jgi:protoporphyrinogen IX oxidase
MSVLDLVPHLKALHVGFIAIWVAGLLALPSMLAQHRHVDGQTEFDRLRHATHYGYIWVITPAAALAVASGTLLVFLREVFTVWMFGKLVFVALLVTVHAWVGHTIVLVAETKGRHAPPAPLVPALALGVAVVGVLALVLAKPELEELPMPAWLLQPLGRELPFDVPSP